MQASMVADDKLIDCIDSSLTMVSFPYSVLSYWYLTLVGGC